MPRRPSAGWAPLVVATLLTVSSCGDDPAARPAASPSATSAPSGSPTGTPDTSGTPDTADASGSPTVPDGVTPASGELLSVPPVQLNGPAGWRDRDPEPPGASIVNLVGPEVQYSLLLSVQERSLDAGDTTDDLAGAAREADLNTPPLARLDDTEVAGLPAYHRRGEDALFLATADEYGFRVGSLEVNITVTTPPELPQAERDQLVASILASVQVDDPGSR